MKYLALIVFLFPVLVNGQAIIPKPQSLVHQEEDFVFRSDTKIYYSTGLAEEAKLLGQRINNWTRNNLVITENNSTTNNAIHLRLESNSSKIGSYKLESNHSNVIIKAGNKDGIFNGIQTLLQLISNQAPYVIHGVSISDHPKYDWRGLMLDSARHFQKVDEVKAFIDLMSQYKYNKFHWHLTDDQGWRLEIKALPNLTKLGAYRVPREGIWWFRSGPQENEEASYGGYYSQDEIRDIVQYAAARHIEIIPEIDVPGHSLALLTAYPELSTTGGPFQVNPGSQFFNVIENTVDPSNPKTYDILDKVFNEVAELFPSEYIHVGGDEATKKYWKADAKIQEFMKQNTISDEEELQSYFIRRMEGILAKYDKKLIGWDEILEGGLAETATVMSWRGKKGGVEAAKKGRQVIMSPAPEYYLDVLQGDPSIEPATYSMSRLTDTYHFDPNLPEGLDHSLLIGLQGNLWTEEVPNQRHAQYMAWPRAFAISEAAWYGGDKDWKDFISRVEHHFERFDKADINYSKAIYDPAIGLTKDSLGNRFIELTHEIEGLKTYYTFDDTEPDHHYPLYTQRLKVPEGAYALRLRTYRDGKPVGKLTYTEIYRIGKGKRIPAELHFKD